MTITRQSVLGSSQSKTAATTTTISVDPTVEPVPGDLIIVSCARDDIASDTFPDTCSDGQGNIYIPFRTASTNATNGTAADGTIALKFICFVAVGWPSGTKTITWTHPSTTARAMVAEHFTSSLGRFYVSAPFSAASTTGVPSAALGSVFSGFMCHGTIAAEGISVTGDADTSNGNWSTQETIATSGSTAATNQAVGTQYKITTATATQTYNPTSASTDATVIVVVLYEDVLPPKWSTLTDNFATEDSAKWDWSDTNINATGGFLTGNILNTYPGMDSTEWYDLTDSHVIIEGYKNSTSLGAATTRSCMLLLGDWATTADNNIRWGFGEGDNNVTWQYYKFGVLVEGGTVSTTDRWLRIRFDDSNDTFYWDSSADGSTWTNRANKTAAQVGIRPTALGLTILFGHYGAEAEPSLFSLDNFNLPPSVTSLPIDDAAVSVTASPLGSHRSTRTNPTVTTTAYNLGVSLPSTASPDDAVVSVAANLLAASNRNLGLASSSVSAFALSVGGVYGPQTGVTQPGGSTTINPGDAYQTKINTAGAGATLWWTTGTYNFSAVAELAPAANQTWVFEYGAVIDGGGVAEVAIGGTATNVTFQNMRVTNFDSPHDIGAVHCYDGTNWTFDHCQFDNNVKCGLHVTYGAEVRWCKFNNNGQAGIMCRGFEAPSTWTTGLWIHHNEIAYNNPNNVEDGDWDAGGLKFFGTDGLLLEYNWAHHNVGPGLWLDIDNKNATIENNTCEDNANHGIFYEISFGATLIDSNICRRNGFGTYGVGGGGAGAPVNAAPAGIFISNSSGVICSNNTVEDNYTGIILINVDRSAENPLYDLYDVQVFDNISTGNTSYAAGIMGEDIPLASLVDVDFQGNIYTGETGDSWHYGEPISFAEWQAEGFDVSAIELTPDDATVSVVANRVSAGLRVGHATSAAIAYALTSSNLRSLDDAAVSAAAYLLSLNGRTPSLATVSTLANALVASIGVVVPTATVSTTAFNLSANRTSALGSATVSTVANLSGSARTPDRGSLARITDENGVPLTDENGNYILDEGPDSNVRITAFNLTASIPLGGTLQTAEGLVTAYNLSRASGQVYALATSTANNLSTGRQLAFASIQTIANNIGLSSPAFSTANAVATAYNLLPTFILGLASVSVTAYNLGTVVNNNLPIGNAPSTVSGFDLSQSGRALGTPTVGATAQGLSVAASHMVANAATTAFDITGLRTAVLGLASVLVEAQGVSSQVPEGIALQSAQSSVEAFGLDNFLLASAGLATVLLTASNIGADNQARGDSTTEVQAFAIGSARNVGIALAAAVSYALTAIREAGNRTANVTASAFGLSIQMESQQGTVRSGNPYTNFKRGGRAFTSLASGKAIT